MFLQNELDLVRSRWGPWTAHNIQLDRNLYTISKDEGNRVSERADLYLQLIKIFAPSNSKQLRVLDLGCLEGGISINLAQAGMNVVGVDVREGHIRKCEFVSDQLNLNDKITWLIGDVNDASLWDSLGYFDVIICSGLLYHIADKDIYQLVKRMRAHNVLNGLTIIDTNITSTFSILSKSPHGSLSMVGSGLNTRKARAFEIELRIVGAVSRMIMPFG